VPEPIRCKVVTQTGQLFEGQVAGIRAPGYEGGFGVKPGHAPYLVQLEPGRLALLGGDGSERFGLDLEHGYLIIAADECTVMVDSLPPEEPAG
jgi:F-type H+-transporting ATPase subunit epsilon